ncbi:phage head closure protein [Heyndrickxia oleronia]|jgi:SPP1 family predicted phage head-tail adaptor|uniref:phage head closure protein n=1 Tax=Heyndrickxia oleronia TaxID=38875 RepID=UPI002430B213|nr:phage head closure protein [Heyndrickxia oleronia]MCI1593219.1 phage head closure protein [Heyndrickxia oleronia]MCI1615460.1 phage head closure protein [Heyndrickxia oleronia]MCI1746190.1 phage head closure protein [Heyndrickxia oleronia]MCI1763573.1 phage head closure protein [Heyndrickxia oleronia]
MNIASLNKRIDVYDNVKYTNELDETAYRFEKLKTIWASIVPQTGSLQKQQADTILTNVTHKIIVRYESGKDISKDMQIQYNDKNNVVHRYEIKYILNPYFANEKLEIFCQELMD